MPSASARPDAQASASLNVVKWAVLFTPLTLLAAPMFWVFGQRPETRVDLGTWALVALSALANVIVIAYHYLIPAHPKFLMLGWRRWVLRAHILSGTTELVAGLIACFSTAPVAARIMAVAALCFHVPSALVQTRIVFGSKAIMVPSYLLCIVTHAFCAAMLLMHPTSAMWAVNTFLVFNVYVWCRIYYYAFDLLKLFSTEKYTIAILAAGATMIPALFGAMGFMLLVGFVGLYILLYRLLFARSPVAYWDFVRERARDRAIPTEVSPRWGSELAGPDRAADFFTLLDVDGDGRLDGEELRRALVPWGLSAPAIEGFAARLLAAGPVDVARFEAELWSIGAIREYGLRALATQNAVSERDRAELVFRHLDVNRDGVLAPAELDLLLSEWGLPPEETQRYLRKVAPGETAISFDAFFRHMAPVWRFIYHEVFRGEYTASRGEMIGRSVAAIISSRRTDALRVRVKHDLLARVPFLQSATDELIGDLAASLVTEHYRAGAVVFTEGEPGDRFYLVASGTVRVTREGEKLADLSVGGCLGEGALLTPEPRAATLTAIDEAVLLALTRRSFEYLTEKYPVVRAQLHALHQDRRVATNRLTLQRRLIGHVPFLQNGGEPLLADLAAALIPSQVAEGELVIREGEPGDRLFVIEHGTVRVSRGGETLAHLSAGACFGEGALLSNSARAASARAVSKVRLFALTREDFGRIVERHPGMKSELLELHRTRNPFFAGVAGNS